MPKRGENIHKRKDGRWEGRYIASRAPDGKACYKSIYGYSYTEVKGLLKSEKQKYQQRKPGKAGKTIEDICIEWLDWVKTSVKESTYGSYHTPTHNHIIPYFNGITADGLTGELIERFAKDKATQGRLDGKGGLAVKTLHDLVSLLLQIIRYAERKQYINKLQYDIVLPNLTKKPCKVLTPIEHTKIISHITEKQALTELGIITDLCTGIRLGELCALTWEDIDFESGILKITKTIQRVKDFTPGAAKKTKMIITEPKSQKSIRDIPLPLSLLQLLIKFSKGHSQNNYILSGIYKPVDPRTYQYRYKRYLNSIGVNYIKFHAMRHTFAARAMETDFEVKSLSEIMGHSTVRFTLDTYGHSSTELKRSHMEKMVNFH